MNFFSSISCALACQRGGFGHHSPLPHLDTFHKLNLKNTVYTYILPQIQGALPIFHFSTLLPHRDILGMLLELWTASKLARHIHREPTCREQYAVSKCPRAVRMKSASFLIFAQMSAPPMA